MIVLFVTGLKQPKEITMKKFSKIIVGVFCALLLATSAFAADTAVKATNAPVAVTTTPSTGLSYLWEQPKVEDPSWVFAIGGSGATGLKGNSETAFGLNLQLGRTAQLLLPFEYGVRQSFSYASSTPQSACTIGGDDDSSTLFTTKLYADWTLLTYKKLDLFAGGNVGLTYGNTSPLWTAAPETGLRFWLKKDVAIEGRVEFPFDLNDGAKFQDAMTYTVGLKLRF